jgi:hypothetical protein
MASNYLSNDMFPPHFALNDFETQLAVFRAAFNIDSDIYLKYLDDENDEVGIFNDEDLHYAYQNALDSSNSGIVRYVIRDSDGNIVAKPKLQVDLKLLKANEVESSNKAEEEVRCQSESSSDDLFIKTIPKDFTLEQLNWLTKYLDKFKSDILSQVEQRLKQIPVSKKSLSSDDDLISFDLDEETDISFELKVQKLLLHLLKAKSQDRHLKAAYLEEELMSTGAFSAAFIKDYNIPDGTQCEPNKPFRKTWLLKNTGKVAWNDENFSVKLINIGGTLNTVDGNNYVNVAKIQPNQTVDVSVDLVAPSHDGKYSSEWVLSCNGFAFGPRIWCSIEVITNNFEKESMINLESSLTQPSAPSENEENKSSFSSSISQEKPFSLNLTTSDCNEDMDDEFVVVPDCFDLTKKWKSTTCDQKEPKSTTIPNSLNQTFDEENMLKHDETLINVSNGLTSNASEIQVISPTPSNDSSTLNIDTLPYEIKTSLSEEDIVKPKSIDLIKLEPAKKIESNITEENSNSSKKIDSKNNDEDLNSSFDDKHNLSSAFDLMKNAFSNLGAPSYGANFDLIDKKNENQEKKQSKPVVWSPKINIKKLLNKTPTSNMDKLLSMGFADRALNERLLKKFDNDMNKVVQCLLDNVENDWYEHRY